MYCTYNAYIHRRDITWISVVVQKQMIGSQLITASQEGGEHHQPMYVCMYV